MPYLRRRSLSAVHVFPRGFGGIERQSQNQIAPGLSVRIEIERSVHTTFQRLTQDQIEPVQVFDHITGHVAANKLRKFALESFRRHVSLEQFEVFRIIDPNIYIRRVALVAGTRMRNVADQEAFVASARAHVSKISHVVFTRSRSIRTDLVSTAGVMEPRKPPPPAGPQHNNDSTSQSINSASLRSVVRRATCSRTSSLSADSLPAVANRELAPITSTRTGDLTPCTSFSLASTISAARRPRALAKGPA